MNSRSNTTAKQLKAIREVAARRSVALRELSGVHDPRMEIAEQIMLEDAVILKKLAE